MESPAKLTQSLKSYAVELGFQAVGICPAQTAQGLARLDDWLARGYAGEMDYLRRRRTAYDHPRSVLADVASIVVVIAGYRTAEPQPLQPGQGRVSRYAWSGHDYHDVLRARLQQLANRLHEQVPGARTRIAVDTAPLLERELAQLAGLGWQGKNTLLLSSQWGSWFFLGELLTSVALEHDPPFATDHCGTCRACLDVCPSQALVAPTVLDASRCLSYLTIEHRSQIPAHLRTALGDWLFGCDLCQEVCPWNRKPPPGDDPAFVPLAELNPVDLFELFQVEPGEWDARFRTTPLARPGRAGLLRNAAIVLGNQRSQAAIPALRRGLSDPAPIVRGAAAWALGQIGGKGCAELRARLAAEDDPDVLGEIQAALRHAESAS